MAKLRHDEGGILVRVHHLLHDRRHIRGREAEAEGQVMEALLQATGQFDLDDGRLRHGPVGLPIVHHLLRGMIFSVYIPDDIFFNATDLVEKLIAEGKKVIRYPLNGTWIDIGNPQEYQKAQDLVKHL